MTNPLLDTSGLPRFDDLKPDHAEPALQKLIAAHRQKLASLLNKQDSDEFTAVIEPLEEMVMNFPGFGRRSAICKAYWATRPGAMP